MRRRFYPNVVGAWGGGFALSALLAAGLPSVGEAQQSSPVPAVEQAEPRVAHSGPSDEPADDPRAAGPDDAQGTRPPARVQGTPAAPGDAGRDRLGEAQRGDVVAIGRLRLFLDETVLSPTLGPRLAFSAALDQAQRHPEEWEADAAGFGRRVAARTGLVVAQAGVQHATAALMRVDPRGERQRCACAHPLRRTMHALKQTFVTRDERGRLVPNVPLVAGATGGALLATAWYPPSYRPHHEAVKVASLTIVAQAGANVAREFAPELKRLVPFRDR